MTASGVPSGNVTDATSVLLSSFGKNANGTIPERTSATDQDQRRRRRPDRKIERLASTTFKRGAIDTLR